MKTDRDAGARMLAAARSVEALLTLRSHREIDYPPPETVAERRRKLQRAKLRIVGGRS